MLTVLSCIAVAHDLRYVALAALICVMGSVLSMRLIARVRRSRDSRRWLWLFLASLVAGSTIWTTHFASMLGYVVPFERSFEPVITLVSLLMVIASSAAGFMLAARTSSSAFIEIGGLIFGLGIAAMHYTGMSAFLVPGYIEWNWNFVVASILLGGLFGAVAMNRISRPVTRFCRYGASVAMIIAIVTMHFTGMSAITIVPLGGTEIPPQAMPDGYMLAAVISINLLILATVGSAYAIDVHSSKEADANYERLALFDALTGLPNRTNAERTLAGMIQANTQTTARVVVVAIDLEQFRNINGAHGQQTGDAVLRQLSARLHDALQPDEFVARIGGDEFIALKRNVFGRGDAMRFAKRLHLAIVGPHLIDDTRISLGSGIGIALSPDHGMEPRQLITRAELAAAQAKTLGSNQICRYTEGMDEDNRNRAVLAIDLRAAIAGNQLEIYYQPQNDTRTREIVGFEALVRWNHPSLGTISPGLFIPIAERNGLILDIGDYVLRQACRDAASWPERYTVAVNVAPYQLTQADLPARVSEVLGETGLDPRRLEIELTESGLIEDRNRALSTITRLRELGVTVAMDDFGTGYSSLALLQNFPFDKIKIDRSFVQSVGEKPQSAAIVRATLLIAESLGIPVLAEGVETEEELSFLREQGCPTVQGFLFGRPMPLASAQVLMLRDGLHLASLADRLQGDRDAAEKSVPRAAGA
ncbi:EAL domain-containing protein [Microvirga tunisiensis]|uniref:EAL domain-containing protein n=2 Tax=Pannonibacter tanglangensis TaxID=2750084 RepID=A0A7X5F5D9_9HYPH|nr:MULTISPECIES: bifunctional diguanylate cyclase/phosphodiesterase [unclassified Pannonibacter]NBN65189.1 EAL domain-containing protein [Pannonibacter sp. XCT-34]NBN79834.1 EAL domain-containing protein [Pannonibacter sp. XCT-53]